VPASVVASSGAAPVETSHTTEVKPATAVTSEVAIQPATAVASSVPAVAVQSEPTAPSIPTAPSTPSAPVASAKVVAPTITASTPVVTSTAVVQPVEAPVKEVPVVPATQPAEAPTLTKAAPTAPLAPTKVVAEPVVQPTQPAVQVETASVAPSVVEKAVVSPVSSQASAPVIQLTKTAPVVSSSGFHQSLVGKKPAELLQQARIAFNHQEMDKSVAIYRYLIKQQPNFIEYKGELGNVFYHQKKPKEAAALYAEIAIPLIKQGKSVQVSNMLGFIGAFYPEKATEISNHLMAK
jgi:hypothetical protein